MILLEGKPIRERIENETLAIVHKLRLQNVIPHLAVVLVGHREDSELYVSIKKKRAHELGIDFSLYRFDEKESQESVINTIKFLNEDKSIHGIIIQLPLEDKFDTDKVISAIDVNKDVDDLKETGKYLAPSPYAIVEIMDEYKIETLDKKIVIVGRGKLVGKPLEKILKDRKLNATAIDSETNDLIGKIKQADILIAATGTPNIITEELIKEGIVIISVGNEVNFERVKNLVEAITPTKGGVGPITVALLLKNTVLAANQSS